MTLVYAQTEKGLQNFFLYDIIAFFEDRMLPVGEIQAQKLAEEVL